MGGARTDARFGMCRQNDQSLCTNIRIGIALLPSRSWMGLDLFTMFAPPPPFSLFLFYFSKVPVCDVPTVLHLFCNDGGYNKQKVLFGCRNGVIGLVDLGVDYSNVSQQMETKSFAGKRRGKGAIRKSIVIMVIDWEVITV